MDSTQYSSPAVYKIDILRARLESTSPDSEMFSDTKRLSLYWKLPRTRETMATDPRRESRPANEPSVHLASFTTAATNSPGIMQVTDVPR